MKILFHRPRKSASRFLFQEGGPSPDPFSAEDLEGLSKKQEILTVDLENEGVTGEKLVNRKEEDINTEASKRADDLNAIVRNYSDPKEKELVVSALRDSLKNRVISYDTSKEGLEKGLDDTEFESWEGTLNLETEAALFMSDPDHGEFTLMALRQIVDKLQQNKGNINWTVFNVQDFKVSRGALCIQKMDVGNLTLFSLDNVGSLENSAGVKIANKEQQKEFLDSLESSLDEHVAALAFCTNNNVNFPDPKPVEEQVVGNGENDETVVIEKDGKGEDDIPEGSGDEDNDATKVVGNGKEDKEATETEKVKEEIVVPEPTAEELQQARQDNVDTAYNIPGKAFLKTLTEDERGTMEITDADLTTKIDSPVGKDFQVLEGVLKYQQFINRQYEGSLNEDGLKGSKTDATLALWRDRQGETLANLERKTQNVQVVGTKKVDPTILEGGAAIAQETDVKEQENSQTPEETDYLTEKEQIPEKLLDSHLANRAERQAGRGNFEKASGLIAKLKEKILGKKNGERIKTAIEQEQLVFSKNDQFSSDKITGLRNEDFLTWHDKANGQTWEKDGYVYVASTGASTNMSLAKVKGRTNALTELGNGVHQDFVPIADKMYENKKTGVYTNRAVYQKKIEEDLADKQVNKYNAIKGV